MVTYAEYLKLARERLDTHPNERYGQAYFNALHDVRPDLANQVSGGDLDPFLISSRVPEFLTFVSARWDSDGS